MKNGWTVRNFGVGSWISVFNYYPLNEVCNFKYIDELFVRTNSNYKVGIWKIKKLK